jgi:hypothetical protein
VIDSLVRWHEFYMLLGTASATMVGLLFVAVTVGSRVFTGDRRAPLRVFVSASVVHFSGILAVCLIVLAPLQSWVLFGALIVVCGCFGLAYYALTWRDMIRDGLNRAIDWDDRIWYAVVPVVTYLLEAAAGVALLLQLDVGIAALAVSTGLLLVVGLRNAWDITVWATTRRRE